MPDDEIILALQDLRYQRAYIRQMEGGATENQAAELATARQIATLKYVLESRSGRPIVSASPTPSADDEAKRDEEAREKLAKFEPTKFYYNKPKTLDFQKASTISLTVASADVPAALAFVKRMGDGPAKAIVERLGKDVRASLDGPPDQVDISLQGDPGLRAATLPVTKASNAEWVWYVVPKTLDGAQA